MKKSLSITILAIGTTGDIYPAIALSQQLQVIGHHVTLAAPKYFKDVIVNLGLEFIPLSIDFNRFFQSEEGRRLLSGNNNFFSKRQDTRFRQEFRQTLTEAWQASQSADVLGLCPLTLWGTHIVEKLNIPCFLFSLYPLTPTRAFPCFQFGKTSALSNPISGLFNILSYPVVDFLMWNRERDVLNHFREQDLGLPPLSLMGQGLSLNMPNFLQQMPILYCYSSAIISPPFDWERYPNPIHIPGFFFLDGATSYNPPQDLVDFIRGGPQPISIGFGSMIALQPEKLTQIVLDALDITQQRAVLISGWTGLSDRNSNPDQLYVINSIPHDWLFPQMAATVHHCGPGTMAAALKAGVPQVTVPFFFDQRPYAQRLSSLGVAPKSVPYKELTVEHLVTAIEKAVNTPAIAAKAKDIADVINGENGARNAAEIIDRHFAN
ncbi:MAG: glycosyltransferase [Cyanobacteria bacterium P01_F01_bin.150]